MLNTRNCTLFFDGKWSEEKILGYVPSGSLIFPSGVSSLKPNAFIFGDNFEIMAALLPDYRETVDLIYIDPPFGTGQDFSQPEKDVAYRDDLIDHEFLAFLHKRLVLLRELLSSQGTIYLHIDKKIGHYVKLIMDEVFGYQNFINDITRIKCNPKNFVRKAYGNYSDMILIYAKKRDQQIWNEIREPLTEPEIKKLFPKIHPEKGRYTTHPLHAPGETLNGDTGQEWNGLFPPKGRHWRYSREELSKLDAESLIEWSSNGNPRKMVFAKDHPGKKVQDVWTFKDKGMSYVSYPTEKNHDLLQRIIQHSSNPDSLVLDAFAGSGGTLINATRLGRKWIGMDQSEEAKAVIEENFRKEGIGYKHVLLRSLK